MNAWASRRKSFVSFWVFIFLAVFIGVPTYFLLQKTPDCNNGLKDGNESGVDCGGSCNLLCTPETLPLISRGDARVLEISPNTYVLTILIENPNVGGEVKRAPYTFSIYTLGGKDPIKTFSRETYIGRNTTFALFEGPFVLSDTGPFRAIFEWGDNLVWEKSDEDTPLISVESMNLTTDLDGTPRLEAKLINRGSKDLFNIESVAIISDADGNTITTNKTFTENISSLESVPIFFSWPQKFNSAPVSIRILPHVFGDKSFVQ